MVAVRTPSLWKMRAARLAKSGSDGETNWAARCTGDCPCAAIITIENETDTTIEGRYNGANCARIFDGTFTGTSTL